MPSDFTVIQSVRQHFGNEANAFVDVEPQVLFVGSSKDFTFNCPNIDPNADAVLMFQSLGVDHNRNILQINRETAEQPSVFGGLLVGENSWNGNVMLITPGVLRESNNKLHVESRDSDGNRRGNLDDFILDNIVVLYKTAKKNGVVIG